MTVIGYARVSTTDQDLSIQEAALKAAGCHVIRAEKRSGTTTEGREALRTVLEFLHAGDVLMVSPGASATCRISFELSGPAVRS
jgi:DNA invertase Pin-like site-specific DNA recombinase